MRVGVLHLRVAVLAACAACVGPSRSVPRATPPPATPSTPPTERTTSHEDSSCDDASSEEPRQRDRDGQVSRVPRWESIPTCSPAEATARSRELEAFTPRMHHPAAVASTVLAELRAVFSRPCLRHAAAAIEPPPTASLDDLRRAWSYGMHGAIEDVVRGIRVIGDRRLLPIPQQIVPGPTPEIATAIAARRCAAGPPSSGCIRAMAYITRAEHAFDRVHAEKIAAMERAHDSQVHVEIPAKACDGSTRNTATTLEAHASCAASRVPTTLRYSERGLRAPDRGWLVIRGRRGHYEFWDEIRAYDLATGAAYVVREPGGLLQGPARAGPELITGTIAAEHVREIAFLLLTRAAIVPVRTIPAFAVIPSSIPIRESRTPAPDASSWTRLVVTSSDQTGLDWTFAGGADVERATGSLTWPDSYDWVDTYIDQLIVAAEAGLVPGCAPARVPSREVLHGRAGQVSPIDADRDDLAKRFALLEAMLEGLAPRACKGAR